MANSFRGYLGRKSKIKNVQEGEKPRRKKQKA